jgi:hypothetical protein
VRSERRGWQERSALALAKQRERAAPGVLLLAIRRGPCSWLGSTELDKLPFLATLANVRRFARGRVPVESDSGVCLIENKRADALPG